MLKKIRQWLRDHSPVQCVRCHYLMFAKDAHFHSTTIGVTAALCHECEREMYRPWSEP